MRKLSLKIAGIYLRFYSEAACEFKRKWFLRSVSVSGTEKYLDETITCLDETNGRNYRALNR